MNREELTYVLAEWAIHFGDQIRLDAWEYPTMDRRIAGTGQAKQELNMILDEAGINE